MIRIRAVLALFALVAAALLGVAPASPASAAPQPCPNGAWLPPCDLPVLGAPDIAICPPPCTEAALRFTEFPALDEASRLRYIDHVAGGLSLLGKAFQTGDPQLGAELRKKAIGRFTAAGTELKGTKVIVVVVVIVIVGGKPVPVLWPGPDPVPYPEPHPAWLAAAGGELADGLNLLSQAGPTPDEGVLDAAMKHFDTAYQDVASQKA